MSISPALDIYNPASAAGVGVELAATSSALAERVHEAGAIADLVAYERAVQDRRSIGEAIKRVQEFFSPIKTMAHRLHKAICEREATILEPLERADTERREAIRLYHDEDRRQRHEQEQRIAEAQRQEREAHAAREAAALETAGEHAAAAAVLAETIATPPPVVALPDQTKGIASFRRTYHWRFIGENRINGERLLPREYMIADEKKIGAYARAMKGTGSIPGIEFFFRDEPVR